MAKTTFTTKIGLIAATVGSAVGLGNIWRFPAETQANGGAAFLIVYVICLLLLGIPVMLAEFSLGRGSKTDAVSAFRKLRPGSKWWIGGALAVLASYLILCFYMVVAGWTFEYLWQSITGDLYSGAAAVGGEALFSSKMQDYICGDSGPLINTFVMIVINLLVLLGGVQKGIERLSNILMPLLFILLLMFAGVALSLPGAGEGVKFFISPDFSKITPAVVVNALGQAFFSLSLGMGILVTYASYFPKKTNLTKTAVTVSLLDLLAAVMMGMIIFPAVASFGMQDSLLEGSTLVFVTLPQIFCQMGATQLWSVLFFLLLLVAALTSTISIAEVSVAWIQDFFKKSRVTACLIVILPLFLFSSICSLSLGRLSNIQIAGLTIFDALDTFATNILLPLVSIITCLFMSWAAKKGFFRAQLTNGGKLRQPMAGTVIFVVKYLAPLLIFLILLAFFVKF